MYSKLRWLIIGLLITITLGIHSRLTVVDNTSDDQNPRRSSLKEVVEEAMAGAQGRYGIVIKNLTSGESYHANEHQIFEPGSLYKLWVMATTFEQIKEGKLAEDQQLAQRIEVLNSKFGIPREEAELREGWVEMTVSQALQQMIIISHNYAALLLSEKFGNSTIAQFLKDLGFNNSSVSSDNNPPQTSPSDIAKFYEQLYYQQLIDQQSSQQMIELLKKQQRHEGLPKYLPATVGVAHKTGDIGWFKHDGGIFFSPAGDYLIVVLSESNYPPGAQERIAQLSRAVFDYFNPQSLPAGR